MYYKRNDPELSRILSLGELCFAGQRLVVIHIAIPLHIIRRPLRLEGNSTFCRDSDLAPRCLRDLIRPGSVFARQLDPSSELSRTLSSGSDLLAPAFVGVVTGIDGRWEDARDVFHD